MRNDFYIKASDFSKSYDSGTKKKYACTSINFNAFPGEISVFLGPNGAGKSTFLKALAGIHNSSSGIIELNKISDDVFLRENVGYVSENPNLNLSFTVKEELLFNVQIYNSSLKDDFILKAVEVCGLNDVLEKKIKTLSKGFMQRVSLASVLCRNQSVLIMDEFSAGLDPKAQQKLISFLIEFSKERILIVSTHNVSEAERLCKDKGNIFIMNNGRLLKSGSVLELLSESKKNSLQDAFLFFLDEKDLGE